tara:strand:- start:651 stop:899 length:249 start_codon:yes stop_codon:yes gene_type:complete
MLIFYPKLSNGNILWSCDNCDNTAQVSFSDTAAVALYCMCNRKINPQCNDKWYNESLYMKRIPIEIRLKRSSHLRELYEGKN